MMKKIMTILALVMGMTVVAQAAQINWYSAGKIDYVKSGVADAAGLNALGLFVLVDLSDNSVVNTGVISGGGPALRDKAMGEFVWGFGDAGAPDNGDVFAVMFQFSSDSSLGALMDSATDTAITSTFTISGMDDNGYAGSFSFATQPFYVVPEPTSMALLALGIAALGLRRRK